MDSNNCSVHRVIQNDYVSFKSIQYSSSDSLNGFHSYGAGFYTLFDNNMPTTRLRNVTFAAFSLLPFFEGFIPLDWSNPTSEQQRDQSHYEKRFRWPLYLWTFVEVFTTIKTLGFITDPNVGFSAKNKLALACLLGLFNGGIGINFSHELIHKSSKFEKVLGYTLLTNVK